MSVVARRASRVSEKVQRARTRRKSEKRKPESAGESFSRPVGWEIKAGALEHFYDKEVLVRVPTGQYWF